MLACARIGAVHSVIFGGFSSESLRDRINDAQCALLVTADGGWRRGQVVPLKQMADEALKDTPSIRNVVVVQRLHGAPVPVHIKEGRDHWYHRLMQEASLRLRAGAHGRRGHALHPLHVRHDREAEGHRPHDRRVTSWAPTRRRSGCSTTRTTTSSGAPPTSAGSPATATSSTVRWPTARPSSCTKAHPTGRNAIASGRSSSATASPSSTRRRRRFARSCAGGRSGPQRRDLTSLRLLGTRRRADQPGGVGLVSPVHRRRALPGRRHVVADGDRRDHDHAAAGDHDNEAGLGDAAVPRDPGRDEERQGRDDRRRRPADCWC